MIHRLALNDDERDALLAVLGRECAELGRRPRPERVRAGYGLLRAVRARLIADNPAAD